MYSLKAFINDEFKQLKPANDQRLKDNFNAFRKEDFDGRKYFPNASIFESDIFKNVRTSYDIPEVPVAYCQVKQKRHGKESINLIRIARIQELKCLLTCSEDGFAKVSNLQNGDLICSLNIYNPLPARWNLQYTKNRKRFTKLKQAFETLRTVNETYRNEHPANPFDSRNKD